MAAAANGVAGAFAHAVTWSVGGVMLPVGLFLALGALIATLEAGRQLATSRFGVSVVSAGWFLPVLVLSLGGPGGDIVIPGNLTGLSYVIGGVVLVGFALGRALPGPVQPGRATMQRDSVELIE